MKRYHLILTGQVQGVGMRYRLYQLARKYSITGSCRNMTNGNVEVFIQGESTDAFLKEALQNKGFIRINDYSLSNIPVIENEKDFIVL